MTYWVHTIFLHLGLLQVISFISYIEPLPAVADALVDLRLGHVEMLLLHPLIHIKVIQQVGRPTGDRQCLVAESQGDSSAEQQDVFQSP